jgi:ATP phosphoribosyltransferase
LEIFGEIFGGEFSFDGRELIMEVGNFRFSNVHNQDVPTYVEYGWADIMDSSVYLIAKKDEILSLYEKINRVVQSHV